MANIKTIGSGTGSTGPGTVSTVATTSVVGVGTTFTSTFTLPATISIAGTIYDIASITDDFHLATVQTQGTNTAVSYIVGLRNYSTIAAWATYVNAVNLNTLNTPEIGQCFNDSEFLITATITLGGWTNSSGTNTVTLTTGSGQSFNDNANASTNALRYNQSNGVGIKNNTQFISMLTVTTQNFFATNLQLFCNSGASNGCLRSPSNVANINFQKNICQDTANNSSNSHAAIFTVLATSGTVYDNAVITIGTVGNGIRVGATTTAGNTAVSSGSSSGAAFDTAYATPIAKDNVAYGFATDYNGTFSSSSSNNATDKSTARSNNALAVSPVLNVTSAAFQSVTAGSEDLRLKSGSVLIDVGTTAGLSTDIIGTSRPQGSAYDIGCWEFVSGGGFTAVNRRTIGHRVGSRSYY